MQNAEITPPRSLDLFVDRRLVAVRAALLEFNPFSGVAAVLLAGVTRHARGPLGGVGPAFRALESDHDPDALVLSHKGRCAACAMRLDSGQPYLVA
mgnify:FL=1